MRHPTLHLTKDDRITTAYAGLALAAGPVPRLGLAKALARPRRAAPKSARLLARDR